MEGSSGTSSSALSEGSAVVPEGVVVIDVDAPTEQSGQTSPELEIVGLRNQVRSLGQELAVAMDPDVQDSLLRKMQKASDQLVLGVRPTKRIAMTRKSQAPTSIDKTKCGKLELDDPDMLPHFFRLFEDAMREAGIGEATW